MPAPSKEKVLIEKGERRLRSSREWRTERAAAWSLDRAEMNGLISQKSFMFSLFCKTFTGLTTVYTPATGSSRYWMSLMDGIHEKI